MLTLYWSPRAASEAAMAALNEVGAEYRAEKIDMKAGEHKSPEYIKINPNGLVPALKLGDGRVMFETAAMVLYLADRYPDAGLAPAGDDPDRAHYYQWLLFLADTIQAAYKRYYWPHRFITDEGDLENMKPRIREQTVHDLLGHWAIVEENLAGRQWMLGDDFSAADIYMLMLAHWFRPVDDLFARCPNVARVAENTAVRPAVRKAREMHER